MTQDQHKAIIVAARNTSAALGEALKAVSQMQPVESHAQREQRLSENRASPTGWPVRRVVKIDDGVTIPERRALIIQPESVASKRIAHWLFESVPMETPSFFEDMPLWQLVLYSLTVGLSVGFIIVSII